MCRPSVQTPFKSKFMSVTKEKDKEETPNLNKNVHNLRTTKPTFHTESVAWLYTNYLNLCSKNPMNYVLDANEHALFTPFFAFWLRRMGMIL